MKSTNPFLAWPWIVKKREIETSNVELMRGHHANKRVYETILKDLRAYDSYSGDFSMI